MHIVVLKLLTQPKDDNTSIIILTQTPIVSVINKDDITSIIILTQTPNMSVINKDGNTSIIILTQIPNVSVTKKDDNISIIILTQTPNVSVINKDGNTSIIILTYTPIFSVISTIFMKSRCHDLVTYDNKDAIISGHQNKTICVLDLKSRDILSQIDMTGIVTSLDISKGIL